MILMTNRDSSLSLHGRAEFGEAGSGRRGYFDFLVKISGSQELQEGEIRINRRQRSTGDGL